jgi:hypothetical protein
LNADAHHIDPRRRCHGARLGRARRRRHQARTVGTGADKGSAKPDCQVGPAHARGVCPQAGCDCDSR